MKKLSVFAILCSMVVGVAFAAVSRGPAVINTTGKIAERVEPSALYSEDCYNLYFGCMDNFCLSDNADGGRCLCSDDNAKYEQIVADVEVIYKNAETLRTIEVEKVEAGANIDIIFGGSREYDDKGNVILKLTEAEQKQQDKQKKKKDLLAMFDEAMFDGTGEEIEDITNAVGANLYINARDLCKTQMSTKCFAETSILTQLYASRIKSDCQAFDITTKNLKRKADTELAEAQKAVRDARMESFQVANKYDRGQCMLEFRKCMNGADVCGSDWSRCVSTIASENMQNQKRKSTAGTKVQSVSIFQISDSTMEMLDARRNICENVLNQCVAVRDMVWPDFLREIAMDLKTAELNAESNMRQSCLGTISNCIQKACKNDIESKGVSSIDSCLAYPDMARSFCKVQIDPCERMEPLIWDYVKDKLAAMRVDACTTEVKDCLTDENRCGPNYASCVGLDTDTIVRMCPYEKLIACQYTYGQKKITGEAVYDELARLVQGIFLNIDNSLMTVCQNAVNVAMINVCGSTEECDRLITENGGTALKYEICEFAIDNDGKNITPKDTCYPSADAIPKQEKLSKPLAGFIKNTLYWGEISYDLDANSFTTWEEYKESVGIEGDEKEKFAKQGFDLEMKQMINSIESAIAVIEADPTVQFCITGREVQGMKIDNTVQKLSGGARFPNLTKQLRGIVANTAMNDARKNYVSKYNELNKEMAKDKAKIATDMDDAELGKICEELAESSTLPVTKAPKINKAGKWIGVGLIAAVGIIGSIFTFGGAGAAALAALGGAKAVGVVTAATLVGAGTLAATNNISGSSSVNSWNYKETVTTSWNATTGICQKVRVYQNCNKVKKNYCKSWKEPVTETEEIPLK